MSSIVLTGEWEKQTRVDAWVSIEYYRRDLGMALFTGNLNL